MEIKVLVADADTMALDITAFALHRQGYDVIAATDGYQALRYWKSGLPEVVVLETALPQVDGLELCRRIRREKDTPIILLGSDNDDESVEKAFEAGADDYLAKPFSHRQLALRIRAVSRNRSLALEDPPASRLLTLPNLVLDAQSHEVTRRDLIARLTPLEFRLLYLLAANEGHAVPSGRLADYVWGYNEGDPSLLKIHVYQIRRKLQMRDGESGVIKAIPRVGYLLLCA